MPSVCATDLILVPNLMASMDPSEGHDFVFTITVDGHREYPTEKTLENPEIIVSGVEDEGERNAWEYYVTLMHETDKFVKELIDAVEARNEPTVLVFYGDHLPPVNMEAKDLKRKYLYNTQYVIWVHLGLEEMEGNDSAYQLMSEAVGRIEVSWGTWLHYHNGSS